MEEEEEEEEEQPPVYCNRITAEQYAAEGNVWLIAFCVHLLLLISCLCQPAQPHNTTCHN